MTSPLTSSTRLVPSATLGCQVLLREWSPPVETIGDVLLIRGLGDHSGRHDWAARGLTRAGYRVTGFDWPGNGGSDGIRGDLPLVEAAGELLDEVCGQLNLAPLGIFAHSTGAFLVVPWLARKAGETAFASSCRWVWFSSPLIRPSHRQPALKIAFATHLARYLPTMTLSSGVHARDCYHTSSRHAGESAFSRAGGHHRISLRFAVSLLEFEAHVLDSVGSLPASIGYLLTQGAEDPVCPAKYAEDLFKGLPSPRKTFLLAANSRHEPFREPDPESFTNAVFNWLTNQGKGGSD